MMKTEKKVLPKILLLISLRKVNQYIIFKILFLDIFILIYVLNVMTVGGNIILMMIIHYLQKGRKRQSHVRKDPVNQILNHRTLILTTSCQKEMALMDIKFRPFRFLRNHKLPSRNSIHTIRSVWLS